MTACTSSLFSPFATTPTGPASGGALKLAGTPSPAPATTAAPLVEEMVFLHGVVPGELDTFENHALVAATDDPRVGRGVVRSVRDYSILASPEGGVVVFDEAEGVTISPQRARGMAVLTRTGDTYCPSVGQLCDALGSLGAVIVNKPEAVAAARCKATTSVALRQAGIASPPTISLLAGELGFKSLRERLGTRVMYAKIARGGTEGRGVRLITSHRAYTRFCGELGYGTPIVAQAAVGKKLGRSVRVLSLNGVASYAMELRNDGSYLSNAAMGGVGRAIEVTPAMSSIANRVCMALGLDAAGIDLADGRVIEANAGFSFTQLARAHGDHGGAKIASSVVVAVLDRYRQERHGRWGGGQAHVSASQTDSPRAA